MKNYEKIIESIFSELFDDNLPRYQNSLTRPIDNNDDVYANARKALSKLDDQDKTAIFDFFKVVIPDTSSTIFGTIDGSHFPPNIDGDFTLIYGDEEIQGSLQDLFIEKAENKGIFN
ncbi:hypothetical protein GPY51_23740 [Photorhabdus laumondii subsp. laumondii]|uniref:Photorhabdus luminescens subsp. laumondii TTO1 complete genome segment 2/17 n=2 Tax=Photorhabdus laumondii subsp. laumondii TaxID=141679 RepID=Q7N9J0_PHOLL|nr:MULTISPECIES: hypothetical protein [Photorhabdus]AWK40316.1 hypothetical protein A4R40_01665 [Photorhabdus laumondii subsp. laumondii]AXG45659.1 hypothetical protein PluTT01m_01745 [Photorhabdus laumondii subsp. laumondii]KTL62484.1 hypothetical protein AA106_20195 [Photorhabdus laumondii subsp. laumondii]MCC8386382.1 hypothetical protein [Photorhabdus laumondii]MCC8415484.1 hypothetical protein [Photorhabdus laumondii]